MEEILKRLKVRNPPNAHYKEGLRVKIQIKDIREETDVDREIIRDRIEKEGIRGRVETAKETPKEAPKAPTEPSTEEPPKVRAQKIGEKIRISEEPVEEPAVKETKTEPEEEVAEAEEEGEEETAVEDTEPEEGEEGAKPKRSTRKKIRVPEAFEKGKPRPGTSMPYQIRVSPFYMANRARFLTVVNRLFEPYMKEYESAEQAISCAKLAAMGKENADKFDLLFHQKMVRDYLNLFTPYRGLLLYHGLGSGKTVSSITIAEGMKTEKRVVVMTPASLKQNFFNELKRAGDPIFRKNQHWKFVSVEGQPDLAETLAKRMSISLEYIRKSRGLWLPEEGGEANFAALKEEDQKAVDKQLDEMIRSKYLDLNYNGLNQNVMRDITSDYSKNPFDNSVVIIDEAHNLINRIINKLSVLSARAAGVLAKRVDEKTPISLALYEMLMKARNARIVLLSGTPIINVPSEIAVMYNILRGYIVTWTLTVSVETTKKVTEETIREMLERGGIKTMDFIEYSRNKIMITRNPFGFVNNSTGKCSREAPEAPTNEVQPPETVGGDGDGRRTKKKMPKKGSRRTKKRGDREDSSIGFVDETSPIPPIVVPADAEYLPTNDPEMEAHQGGGSAPYRGVCLNRMGNISDHDYIERVKDILTKNGIKILVKEQVTYNKCLPDRQKDFMELFVEEGGTGTVKNTDLLTRRILGLTSYFRSAQESLLPKFVKTKTGENYHIVKTDMSKYQFETYAVIRKEESDKEAKSKTAAKQPAEGAAGEAKDGKLFDKISSTYRIMSRACCNFAWPEPPGRPSLNEKDQMKIGDAVEDAMIVEGGAEGADHQEGGGPKKKVETAEAPEVDPETDPESAAAHEMSESKNSSVIDALTQIDKPEYMSPDALAKYSPKFLAILQNIRDEVNVGNHLVYSSFRTLEGIGILKSVLRHNGFQELKLTKTEAGEWAIDGQLDPQLARFALYTGTEEKEEKEIIRNIYNGAWDAIPPGIAKQLEEFDHEGKKNTMGGIIRVFMITASGAEGINLKNTRFVHIVEPYWNMVRVDQVVGRARRICSHEELPLELRTVQVFFYLTVFSEEQKKDRNYNELMAYDISRFEKNRPITTDENLYEISVRKDAINQQILDVVKSSAIDCVFYNKDNPTVCFAANVPQMRGEDDVISYPTLEQDQQLVVRKVRPKTNAKTAKLK